MQITGGSVQSQSQRQFERNEQRMDVRSQSLPMPPAAPPDPFAADAEDPASLYDGNFSLLRALVESLIGEQIDTLEVHGSAPRSGTGATAPAARAAGGAIAASAVHIQESELTEVAFQGRFDTADGQVIEIDLHYRLERLYEETSVAVAANQGTQRDPLILNFDGRGVELSPLQTRFDLDSDGEAESIPTLANGSAYLALDRDGNGSIDSGRELFGPSTNNGYAALAEWDSDNNGFIDSGDPVFAKLRLFRPGLEPETLAERDVGAIFLGAAASEARLTDTRNQSLGQLRATGFYLTNSGGTGLVQEFDLTV